MSIKSTAINTVVIYKFIQLLVREWKDNPAYELGIIDENGKTLKKARDLKTSEEKEAYTMFHRLVFNIKRLLSKVPGGSSKLGSFAAALWLLKESEELNEATMERIVQEFMEILEKEYPVIISEGKMEDLQETPLKKGEYKLKNAVLTDEGDALKKGEVLVANTDTRPDGKILGQFVYTLQTKKGRRQVSVSRDDLQESVSAAPANVAAAGGLAGSGHTEGDVVVVKRPTEPTKRFAGCDVFEVDGDTFSRCKDGKPHQKHWKSWVGDDESGKAIRDYATKNPNKSIIIQDKASKAMLYVRKK